MIHPAHFSYVLFLIASGLALVTMALTAQAAPANSATIRTYPSNTPPCDTTLQACVSGADDGDSIIIAPNTYLTTSLAITKAVSLSGGGANPAAVRLRPLSGRMIQTNVPITASFAISNLTVENGSSGASSGGGIRVQSGAAPLFANLVISNNSGAGGAGLRIIPNVPATLINVSLTSNRSSSQGGGISTSGDITLVNGLVQDNWAAAGGGGVFAVGALTIIDATFQRNSVSTTVGLGGGLLVNGSLSAKGTRFENNAAFGGGGAFITGSAALTDALFLLNSADESGGGLRTTLAVTLTNSTFMSNTSNASGGGLRANTEAFIDGGSFIANTADQGGGALVGGVTTVNGTLFGRNLALSRGGGLDVVTATVRAATFDQNQTLDGNGGGMFSANVLSLAGSLFTGNAVITGTQANATGSGGGLFAGGVTTSTGNVFFGNFARRLGGGMDAGRLTSRGDEFRGNNSGPQGSGGGLFVLGVLDLDSGFFFTNTANTAGGLGINSGGSGAVVNSLFARNVVTFTDGGSAMRLLSNSSVLLAHNTIVGIPQPGRAAIHLQSAGSFSFYANVFAQHAQGIKNFGTVTPTENYNLFYSVTIPFVGPMITGSQSLAGNPRFLDPVANDYHLGLGSAAIDVAPSFGVSRDADGQLRPMGAGFDLGFDEALPPRLYLPIVLK